MEEYINSGFYINQRSNKIIVKYCFVLLLIFTGILGLSFFINYKLMVTAKAVVVKEDNYYLKLYVKEDDIYKYLNNKKIIIMNKIIPYNVISINSDYLLDDNMNKYKELKISINFDKEIMINNNIIEIKKIYKEIKIINILTKKIKGEKI